MKGKSYTLIVVIERLLLFSQITVIFVLDRASNSPLTLNIPVHFVDHKFVVHILRIIQPQSRNF